ncbi:MAG: hypothetical protein IJA60_04560 [Clostridia bacterium]|nr:hypothetical protein [Clostridia bacterium]
MKKLLALILATICAFSLSSCASMIIEQEFKQLEQDLATYNDTISNIPMPEETTSSEGYIQTVERFEKPFMQVSLLDINEEDFDYDRLDNYDSNIILYPEEEIEQVYNTRYTEQGITESKTFDVNIGSSTYIRLNPCYDISYDDYYFLEDNGIAYDIVAENCYFDYTEENGIYTTAYLKFNDVGTATVKVNYSYNDYAYEYVLTFNVGVPKLEGNLTGNLLERRAIITDNGDLVFTRNGEILHESLSVLDADLENDIRYEKDLPGAKSGLSYSNGRIYYCSDKQVYILSEDYKTSSVLFELDKKYEASTMCIIGGYFYIVYGESGWTQYNSPRTWHYIGKFTSSGEEITRLRAEDMNMLKYEDGSFYIHADIENKKGSTARNYKINLDLASPETYSLDFPKNMKSMPTNGIIHNGEAYYMTTSYYTDFYVLNRTTDEKTEIVFDRLNDFIHVGDNLYITQYEISTKKKAIEDNFTVYKYDLNTEETTELLHIDYDDSTCNGININAIGNYLLITVHNRGVLLYNLGNGDCRMIYKG